MTGRPRLLASATIVSAAAACSLAPVLLDAATVWLPASDLSAAGGAASGAKVAADATGGMIVVWRRFDGSGAAQIQVITRTPQSGAWSSPRTLASDDVNVPDVAVDPTGGATVVWKRFDGNNYVIQAVAKSSQGVWAGTPLSISQTGQNANDPDVTVDNKGIATAVWKRFDGNNFVIQASTRSAAGIWETPVTISLAGADAANPHVASDAAGNLVASWKRFDGNNNLVEVARRPTSGAWTTPQTLSAPGQHGNGPLVAVGPDGTTAVSWFRSDGSSSLVQVATGPAATGLYPADTLSVPGQDAVNARVAVDGTGTALAVWRRFDGSHDVIQFASKPLNGQWTAPERLSDAGQDANSADITVDPVGNVLVAWVRREGADDVTRVTSRSPGGTWQPAQSLSAAGQSAASPAVALSANGTAAVVWTRSDGANTLVQASVRPSEGPAITGLNVPATAATRTAINLNVQTAPGPFPLAGEPKWSFGDGGVGSGSAVTHSYAAAGDFTVIVSQADTAGNQVSVPRQIRVTGGAVVPRAVRITGLRATPRTFKSVATCQRQPVQAKGRCSATSIAFTSTRAIAAKLIISRTDSGKAVGAITVRAKKGGNRVGVRGIVRGRQLAPGRYLLRLVPDPPSALSSRRGSQTTIVIT